MEKKPVILRIVSHTIFLLFSGSDASEEQSLNRAVYIKNLNFPKTLN